MKTTLAPLLVAWLVAVAALAATLTVVRPWSVDDDVRLAAALGLAWCGPYLVLLALAWQVRKDASQAWLNALGTAFVAAFGVFQAHQVFADAAANPLAKVRALVVPCVGVALLMGCLGALRMFRRAHPAPRPAAAESTPSRG